MKNVGSYFCCRWTGRLPVSSFNNAYLSSYLLSLTPVNVKNKIILASFAILLFAKQRSWDLRKPYSGVFLLSDKFGIFEGKTISF